MDTDDHTDLAVGRLTRWAVSAVPTVLAREEWGCGGPSSWTSNDENELETS